MKQAISSLERTPAREIMQKFGVVETVDDYLMHLSGERLTIGRPGGTKYVTTAEVVESLATKPQAIERLALRPPWTNSAYQESPMLVGITIDVPESLLWGEVGIPSVAQGAPTGTGFTLGGVPEFLIPSPEFNVSKSADILLR